MQWSSVEPIKREGVYALFIRGTEECLYVGESGDIHTRINSHFSNRETGSDLRSFLLNDNNSPIEEKIWTNL